MIRTTTTRTPIVLLAFALVLFVIGCSSDDSPTNPGGGGGSTTATIGPSGGTLAMDGGDFTVAIPAGALGEEVTITATRQTGEDVPAELAALGVTESWSLEPTDLVLTTPATLSHTLPAAKNTESHLAAAVVTTDDGIIYTSPRFDIVLQDGVRTLNGELSAFGSIGIADMTFAKGRITGVPATIDCGATFTAKAEYRFESPYENMLNDGVYWEDLSGTVSDNPLSFTGSDGPVADTGRDLGYTADDEGLGTVFGRMVFRQMQPFVQMPAVSVGLQMALDATCGPCDTGGGGDFTGTRPSPVNLPEALVVIARAWASSSQVQDFLVGVAGGNGWGVLDVATGAIALDDFIEPFRPLFGLVALAAAIGPDKNSGYHEAVVSFGPGGAGFTSYTNDAWGWTQLFEMQNPVYDATNFSGPLGAAGCTYAASTAIRSLAWDDNAQAFVGAGQMLTYGDFAEPFQTLVSAVADSPTDPVLIVEDRGTEAGRIWLHGRNGVDATVIGSAGVSPRKVRAAGGIAAVSSFGDDLLTIVQWDGGATATVAGTVAVGDGPVGIDVLDLADGTVAIVSTGFNDDTYTLTVVDAANGAVLSNVTSTVPDGGQAPGHAAWVRDGSRRFAISCNGSNEIVVVDSGL